ncbi:MAG: AMP-binding protein, partial [Alphaproteobacteria bacterium]|nr:AMP-binding protein [Alphaproteobacteria bacterium]
MTNAEHREDPYAKRPWLSSYPAGVPAEIDQSSYSTLVDMFNASVVDFADRTAMESFGATLTFEEFGRAAVAVAAWLQTRGLRKGDRVAIMSPNVLAYPATLFGV